MQSESQTNAMAPASQRLAGRDDDRRALGRARLEGSQEPGARVSALLGAMFVCFIAGLGLIVLSRTL
jgi:hypothetical protein